MKEGSYTLWGKAQCVAELAPGAWLVSTASHGGIKLDRKRNAAVPRGARQEGGWYEEDCQWAIAAYVHEDVGDAMLSRARAADPAKYDGTTYLTDTIKAWESPNVVAALGIA